MTREQFGKQLNLSEELIPSGKRNRPGTKIKPAFITIHNTDNVKAGADATAHSSFVRKTGHYVNKKTGKVTWVSWHYTVDDKRVIQHLPIKERGYHAGTDGNGRSVAIEICMHKGIDQEAAFLRAARLVAALLHDLKLKDTAVVTHQSWTSKACPQLLLDKGKAGAKWSKFLDLVREQRAQITA